jgi:uncharacterized protein YihD (DUF1040 family)
MKKEITKEILQLIEYKGWQELTEFERVEVLQHMSKEEYHEAHEATLILKGHLKIKPTHARIQKELENGIFKTEVKSFQLKTVISIAASFFIIGIICAAIFMQASLKKSSVVELNDTVYIYENKYVDKLVHDTIIQVKERISHTSLSIQQMNNELSNIEAKPLHDSLAQQASTFRILGREELKTRLDNYAGRSMSEDTIRTKIGVISI